MSKGKVVVGMSGGVDSSVAALILKKQGYDVIGITMQIWQKDLPENDGGCCGLSAVDDARKVAWAIDIPHYVLNFRDVFKEKVIDYFVSEYFKARTPNPCIACNRYVKWEALLNRSIELGADFIATGHYAKIEKLPNGRFSLKKSVTDLKDQTYALYNLTQEQLKHTLFPIGDYSKDEIRKIAFENDLPVANKPDSQEICFVPDDDYRAFIAGYSSKKVSEGNFIDESGNILGKHTGITNYTIGQRKGLGIALGVPVYVADINPNTNEVTLASNESLFTDTVYVTNLNYMAEPHFDENKSVVAKIRYNGKGAECKIKYINDDVVKCTFEEKVRAVTPGQAAVFYTGDFVLGGGTIVSQRDII